MLPCVLNAARNADGFKFIESDVVSFLAHSRAMRWRGQVTTPAEESGSGGAVVAEAAHAEGGGLGVLVVAPSDSLRTAMDILVRERVHRVYVVDAANKPVGVVSIKDVIHALVS